MGNTSIVLDEHAQRAWQRLNQAASSILVASPLQITEIAEELRVARLEFEAAMLNAMGARLQMPATSS